MSKQQILDAHRIQYEQVDGDLFALEVYVAADGQRYETWKNVTFFTHQELMFWLGY